MSIESFIQSKCKQTICYWGNPVNDGRGKYTFDNPEEIEVRWEDEKENFAKDSRSRMRIDKDGREYRANAKIFTTEAPSAGWDLDGYVYLGDLEDVIAISTPYDVAGAYEIKQIDTLTSLNDASVVSYVIYI